MRRPPQSRVRCIRNDIGHHARKITLDALHELYGRLVVAADPSGGTRTALLAANGGTPPGAGTTFIADPEGNLMLHYAPGYARDDLNKDLKKLLKWSGR